jgi:hypothetical protein
MNIDTKTLAFATIFASALFLIFNSENIHFGTYGQVSENISNSTSITSNGNLTGTENTTGSNTTNPIPYVLNVTNSSDISSQAVDQVIQGISGGQSTSLQEVLDATSNGNSSSSSLEQVIDEASSVLNNQRANISTGNTSNNTSSNLP